MSADRFSRLETLFEGALAAADPEAWIVEHCEEELADDLRDLLRCHFDEDGDAVRDAVRQAFEQAGATLEGRTVGGYRILSEIGRGGMGTVYEAVRDPAEFEQRVALKLMRLGLRDPASVVRFRRERRLLARLSHPNIASLIDGGTAEDGTPWVAMELVHGRSLVRHVEEEGLDLRARVRLFVRLCRAVAYAHRNLIVHRDLKPENVIVDERGEPKVLDFGVAKLLDDEAEGTATLARAFTPTHASPEQVLGEPITLACDVYSLGVMLFELSTGALPYEVSDSRRTDWLQVICHQPPTRPSSQRPGLPTDLDHIILECLRKEPERRYASAAELADDLQRFLDLKPVRARPDRIGYRAAKLVQRHPMRVVAGALIAILAAVAVINTLVQSRRVAAERDRAVREAAVANETTGFLVELFQTPDPKEQEQHELTAAELLERGAERIDELGSEPLVRARLLHVIGLAQSNLGRYDSGIARLKEALELRRAATGEDSAATADSRNRLGNVLRAAGRYREAEPHLVAALAHRVRAGEGDSVDLADSYNNVGLLQSELARYQDAARNLEQAVAMHRRLHGDTVPVAVALHNLALVRLGQARPADAIDLLTDALAIKRDQGMAERSTYANSLAVLARAQLAARDPERALTTAEESLALRIRILPPDHPQIATGTATRAEVEAALGRTDEALAGYDAAIGLAEEAYGSDSWRTLRMRGDRARLWEATGDVEAAIGVYRQVLERARREFEAPSLHVARAAIDVGRALLRAGRPEDARAILRDARSLASQLLREGHPVRLEARWLESAASGEAPELPAALTSDPRLSRRLLRASIRHGKAP